MATTEMGRGRSKVQPTIPAGPFAAGTPVRRQRKRGFLALAAALVVLFAVGTYAAFTYFSATHSAIAVAARSGTATRSPPAIWWRFRCPTAER